MKYDKDLIQANHIDMLQKNDNDPCKKIDGIPSYH